MTRYVLVTLSGLLLMVAAAGVTLLGVVLIVIADSSFDAGFIFKTAFLLFAVGYVVFLWRRFIMNHLSKLVHEHGEDVVATIRSVEYGGIEAVKGEQRASWYEVEAEIPLDEFGCCLTVCIDQLFDDNAVKQLVIGNPIPLKFDRELRIAMVAVQGAYVRLNTGSFFPWLHKISGANH